MINERLRKRLKKDRPTTTISVRIPIDVLDSLKGIAPTRGFNAYQTLLKSYIGDGLRRDEAQNPHVGSSGNHEDQEADQVADGQSGTDKRLV